MQQNWLWPWERLKVDVLCIAPRRMRASIGEKPYVASCNGPSFYSLDDFDAVVVRSVPGGSLEQVILGLICFTAWKMPGLS